MNEKICPLSFDISVEDYGYCMGEKCAWWDDTNERCVIFSFRLFEEWLKFLNEFLKKKEV